MRNRLPTFIIVVALLVTAVLAAACAAPTPTPAPAPAPKAAAPAAAPKAAAPAPAPAAPKTTEAAKAPAAAPAKAPSGEPYKIVWIGSSTGAFGVYGDPALKAAQLALEAVNKKGGINSRPLEMVQYDDESKPERALELTKKAMAQDNPVAVLGFISYLTAAPAAPVLDEAKIPTEILSGGYGINAEKEKNIFVLSFPNGEQVNTMAAYLKKKGQTKIGLLLTNDALGELVKRDLTKAAPVYGLTFVAEEKFNVADKDVTAQLSKLKAAGAQAVVGWATGAPATLLAKNAVQVNIGGPLVATAGNSTPAWAKTVADLPGGSVLLPSVKIVVYNQLPDSDPSKSKIKEFYDAWKAKYPTVEPAMMEAEGWTTVTLLADAIASAGADRAKIRDYLEGLKDYKSAMGAITRSPSDHIGISGEKEGVAIKIVNGNFALAD